MNEGCKKRRYKYIVKIRGRGDGYGTWMAGRGVGRADAFTLSFYRADRTAWDAGIWFR